MRTGPAVEYGQGVARGVSTPQVPLVAAATVHEYRYETPVGDGGNVVLFCTVAREQAGLHIRHNPGTFAVAPAPGGGCTVICGLHRTGSHCKAVGRRVAVVEAAAAVVVFSVYHIVDSLRFVIDCQAARIVAAISHSRHNEGTIDLLSIQQGGSHIRYGTGVEVALVRAEEGPGRRRQQVVAQSRLVVDCRDVAHSAFAEGILGSGVSYAVALCEDVEGCAVAFAGHLIERTAVSGVEQTGGTVGGDAGCAAFGVDVARTFFSPCKTFAGNG